jgi:hypothetical protein
MERRKAPEFATGILRKTLSERIFAKLARNIFKFAVRQFGGPVALRNGGCTTLEG